MPIVIVVDAFEMSLQCYAACVVVTARIGVGEAQVMHTGQMTPISRGVDLGFQITSGLGPDGNRST